MSDDRSGLYEQLSGPDAVVILRSNLLHLAQVSTTLAEEVTVAGSRVSAAKAVVVAVNAWAQAVIESAWAVIESDADPS